MNSSRDDAQLPGSSTLLVTLVPLPGRPRIAARPLGGIGMTAGKWLSAAALALGLMPGVAAADYWRYTTESGSLAFTDDVKNVPAKYKASAERIQEEKLDNYHRLSIVDSATAAPRVAGPRIVSEPAPTAADATRVAAPVAAPKRDGAIVTLDVGGVKIDVDADSDEPIYVDKQQYSDENGYIDHNGYMAPTTIVRRGDKPLAYIDER
jgi:hypothetical protein